ncbi:hypothetical protein PEDI_03430 [Persicobacter diffluens]|uniref:Uncharacterized protein n=1 Tax=Persicobacter diffluens TaxID=981 RepID=A0AAN4VVF2_9BACT|nr:hypothetical protein PEDI_03430 [Persicobacter diffluens]
MEPEIISVKNGSREKLLQISESIRFSLRKLLLTLQANYSQILNIWAEWKREITNQLNVSRVVPYDNVSYFCTPFEEE